MIRLWTAINLIAISSIYRSLVSSVNVGEI